MLLQDFRNSYKIEILMTNITKVSQSHDKSWWFSFHSFIPAQEMFKKYVRIVGAKVNSVTRRMVIFQLPQKDVKSNNTKDIWIMKLTQKMLTFNKGFTSYWTCLGRLRVDSVIHLSYNRDQWNINHTVTSSKTIGGLM